MAICLEHISKAYGGRKVLNDFNARLERGGVYCLMGASGIGKTTLLRILMGLEQPDLGQVVRREETPDKTVWQSVKEDQQDAQGSKRHMGREKSTVRKNGRCKEKSKAAVQIGAVFQEDRLFEFADAWKNVELVCERGSTASPMLRELLSELLEKEAWHRPVCELSGGMRRRVSIARALASPSELLVMDEPFAGLDEETKKSAVQTILKYREGRTLLVVTHQEEDAALLKAEQIFWIR